MTSKHAIVDPEWGRLPPIWWGNPQIQEGSDSRFSKRQLQNIHTESVEWSSYRNWGQRRIWSPRSSSWNTFKTRTVMLLYISTHSIPTVSFLHSVIKFHSCEVTWKLPTMEFMHQQARSQVSWKNYSPWSRVVGIFMAEYSIENVILSWLKYKLLCVNKNQLILIVCSVCKTCWKSVLLGNFKWEVRVIAFSADHW